MTSFGRHQTSKRALEGTSRRVYMNVSIGQRPVGQLEFELFTKAAPKTCENFRALCTGERGIGKSGGVRLHYKDCLFHRIIPGFMAQGGDFTKGDGTGGESIYGSTFKDELGGLKLKHDRAGLLSMANAGPNTNGSQFFLTFAPAPHLNGRHVVFGEVVDGSDALRIMEKVSTGANDKPRMPVVITDCGEIQAGADEDVTVGGEPSSFEYVGASDKKKDFEGIESSHLDEEKPVDEEEDQEEDTEKEVDISGMSETQKRLHMLKLKLNASRKANRVEVKEEFHRLNASSSTKKNAKDRGALQEEFDSKQMKNRGTKKDWNLHQTAEAAAKQYEVRDKKERGRAAFGWEMFGEEAQYRGHEKRYAYLEDVPTEDLEQQKNNSDGLTYGGGAGKDKPSKEGVERMAKEANDRKERRSKFSRRRAHYDSADIDSINPQNETFNKKLKRQYDKYTVEIRQNLERGTAL